MTATGYRNVLWGDDYPHLEGTYGHTQETLRGLFDRRQRRIRERVTAAPSTSCSGSPPRPRSRRRYEAGSL